MLPIDKWVCPLIEIVEMQQATSAGAGIQFTTCRPRYRLDSLQRYRASEVSDIEDNRQAGIG